MAKDLEYYIAQARRIEEHRVAGVEKEIRKLYKSMLTDLQQFMSGAYVQYAEDDKLTYAMLQKAGYDARFLEEIEKQLNISTPKAAAELRKLVEETYKAAYEGMVQGVAKAAQVPLDAAFAKSLAITPEQIRAAVENPVSGLTLSDRLEKNRKEIIYNIKQAVGVGLMNGDRYTTMAKRIAEHLDGDYKKAIRIARTEAHRVREAGNIDAAVNADKEMQNGTTGMRLVKTWKSMKDERVRPQQRRKTGKGWKTTYGKGPANHMKMDGQVRLADEPFDMGHGGYTAMAPGQSGNAGDDINCRCYASYTMMSDAEYYAKTGKHFLTEQQTQEQFEALLEEAADDYFDYENAAVMKEYIRTGKMPRKTIYTEMELTEEQRERLRREADAIQQAAESTQNKNKRVYRGAIYDDVSEFMNAYGQKYTFDSITSTSPSKKIASIYLNNTDFDESATQVLFEIENSRGIIGFERDEGETILPKGATYTIKRVFYDEDYVLHVQLYSTEKLEKGKRGK